MRVGGYRRYNRIFFSSKSEKKKLTNISHKNIRYHRSNYHVHETLTVAGIRQTWAFPISQHSSLRAPKAGEAETNLGSVRLRFALLAICQFAAALALRLRVQASRGSSRFFISLYIIETGQARCMLHNFIFSHRSSTEKRQAAEFFFFFAT